jgi:choline kinase
VRRPALSAVILAAGRGERLRPLTDRSPKTLLPVAGKPILGRLLDALEELDVRTVVIVTGYRSARVRAYVRKHHARLGVRYVRNAVYATTNTLYSLIRARQALGGGTFLLIDGDLALEPSVLRLAAQPREGNFVLCDGSVRLDDEAVRASGTPGGKVLSIGKKSAAKGKAFGESIGIARIDGKAARRLFQMGRKLIQQGGRQLYYEAAFQALIDEGFDFGALNVRGLNWVEIDTKSDLKRARSLFGDT